MDYKNRKELIALIEQQDDSLQKYKKRLHDVIELYKRLQKEKETLETSIKSLTEVDSSTSENKSAVDYSENYDHDVSNDGSSESLNGLEMLKKSLRTLTVQKTQIESELKADKKKLLKEKEDLQEDFEKSQDQWIQDKIDLETTIRELKKQIRDQQRDREQEQQDYAVMLKELQSLVADERASKEKLEQQVDNLKLALEKLPDKRFEYEKRIIELESALDTTRGLLEAAEGEKKDMPSLLRQLQLEMQEMKESHQQAVEREIKRANQAEGKLKALASTSEERSSSLEQRLSELSQMVGNYDKLRQQDLMAIHKLKERVTQLDQENNVLAKTVAANEKNIFDDNSDSDVQALIKKISKLKGDLHLAYQKTKGLDSLSDLFGEVFREDDLNSHAACQKEIQWLQAELEEYKQKINTPTEICSTVPAESPSEVATLKQQVIVLQDELQSSKMQMQALEQHYEKVESNSKTLIDEIKTKHKQDTYIQQCEHKAKIFELEQQLKKQRERTISLLDEKDKEITYLKSSCHMQLSHENKRRTSETNAMVEASSDSQRSSVAEDNLTDLFSGVIVSTRKGQQLLHYTQEMARKDVEISNLRKIRSQAESALRDLQQTTLLKEEKYQDEIENLKAQINRLQCMQKGINMEYLKNVVLRYIKCRDPNDQSHMINAIAAVLHFTSRELYEVKEANQAWLK